MSEGGKYYRFFVRAVRSKRPAPLIGDVSEDSKVDKVDTLFIACFTVSLSVSRFNMVNSCLVARMASGFSVS